MVSIGNRTRILKNNSWRRKPSRPEKRRDTAWRSLSRQKGFCGLCMCGFFLLLYKYILCCLSATCYTLEKIPLQLLFCER